MNAPKLMLIGLDSIGLSLLDSFKDAIPAIRRLMRRGLSGHVIPEFPIYTPTNWAALATGADSGTSGTAAWHSEHAGRRLSTFDRRAIQCDTIFDAAARAGLKTLAIAYPSAHPTRSRANMVLAPLDRGLVSNALVPGKIVDCAYDSQGAFEFVLVKSPAATSGAGAAKAVAATEDGADLGGRDRVARAGHYEARLVRAGRGAWRLHVRGPGLRRTLDLAHQVWGEPIAVRVAVADRPGKCVVRVMVFDGGRRLAVSEAYDIGALGKPAALAREVYAALGPPIEHSVFYKKTTELFGEGREDRRITRLARADLTAQAQWIVRAARMVLRQRPYDLFYLHHHYPDSVLHAYLAAAEGSPAFSPRQHALARAAIRMCLGICDRLVGGLLELAGPRTTVLLVSDHGNVPNRYGCNLALRLEETGLLVRNADGSVSRRRSVAWPAEGVGTWVTVNGREGTRRYGRRQRQVLDALLDWKTPNGERVVALALRRKDSHLLGYHGEVCADVTFHYNSGFSWSGAGEKALAPSRTGANHGPQMPVTFSKLSDNMAFFVLTGPGVRRGVRWPHHLRGYPRMADLLPTICHVARVPPPRHVVGAIRYEVLG